MYMFGALAARAESRSVSIHSETLKREGFIILRDVVSPAVIAALDNQLAERFEQTPFCVGNFSGPNSKRFGALLKQSSQARLLALHPLMLALAESILGPNCDSIQLNLTQAIELHPGAPAQIPHRDHDMYGAGRREFELCVNVMWPTTEFTARNGATTLWRDSARLHPLAIPPMEEAVRAVMEPGSALVFLGSTLHCGGANRSDRPRRGLVIGYSLGWLKQYENQYLIYPPEVARGFPRPLAELVGYRTQRPNLNNYEGRCPSILLDGEPAEHPGFVDNLPDEMDSLIGSYAADPERFVEQAALAAVGERS